ncbi:hydrolase [Nocardia sp. NPDC059764]|uniref:hydrolase n=1 Tax=Nocardia sp. NPDC059764 TaxID=3346939 RepID=UPI00364B396A
MLAAEHADAAEAAYSPSPVVIRAVVAAGFARHCVPLRLGGPGGTFAELKEAATIIGAECPATAWCAVVMALMARTAGYLSPDGRRQLWGAGPDVFIAGGVAPRGTAESANGGWLLSGVWPLVSGCEHADWVLLSATATEDNATTVRMFVVPCAAVGIEATWDDVGMCATGSHSVVVDQVFVPVWMSFPYAMVTEVDAPAPGPDGRAVPMLAVNSLLFCLPMLGAARGALAQWARLIQPKLRDRPPGTDPVLAHLREVFARSSGEIDAAELILDRVVGIADTAAQVGQADVVRNQRDCALAADLLITAVDRLMRSSGTKGHSARGGLQRLWRDIHTAGGHAALQFGPAAVGYSRENLER